MSKIDLILGIDPGIGGAIAWMTMDGHHIGFRDCPRAEKKNTANRGYDVREMHQIIDELVWMRKAKCAVEQVHARRNDGVAGAFSFGFGFAIWQGALLARGVDIEFVDSRRWFGDMGMPVERDRYKRKKNSRLAAMKFWPAKSADFARVKDDGRAEALLIAEWLRRREIAAEDAVFDMTKKARDTGELASPCSGKGGWVFKHMSEMKKNGF